MFDIYMRTVRAHPELTIRGVFDIRPERMQAVQAYYGFATYDSLDALLADPEVDIVINLTNIGGRILMSPSAHIEAGKHVYSEKAADKRPGRNRSFLFETARAHAVRLYAAPSNVYSDSVRTIFDAVKRGRIGQPKLVYAELDDNPIHLMDFESVRSPTGAPWPLEEEIHEGCTFEHVGYHLVWICALFGPAVSVVAASNELLQDKSASTPGLSGTPDYSVALLTFAGGQAARISTTVVAPRDHRMRVIGDTGEITADSYRHYQSPVYLERFTKRSLSARKFQTLRSHPFLGRDVRDRRAPPAPGQKLEIRCCREKINRMRSSLKQRAVEWLRRREVYAQDKLVGVAEMARELSEGQDQYLSPDFSATPE